MSVTVQKTPESVRSGQDCPALSDILQYFPRSHAGCGQRVPDGQSNSASRVSSSLWKRPARSTTTRHLKQACGASADVLLMEARFRSKNFQQRPNRPTLPDAVQQRWNGPRRRWWLRPTCCWSVDLRSRSCIRVPNCPKLSGRCPKTLYAQQVLAAANMLVLERPRRFTLVRKGLNPSKAVRH